jgi:hypothetical protein
MIVLSDEDRAEIARFVARQPLRSAKRKRTPALHACRVPNTPRRARANATWDSDYKVRGNSYEYNHSYYLKNKTHILAMKKK